MQGVNSVLPFVIIMNKIYLRDALDSFKGEVLRHALCIDRVVVFPMMVGPYWPIDDWRLYSKIILGGSREANRILQKYTEFKSSDRDSYFTIPEEFSGYDIFVDPDTGIEPPSGKMNKKHIGIYDVSQLAINNRIIAIYQHKGRGSKHEYVADVVKRLFKRGLDSVGLYGGNASIVFVSSMKNNRLEKVERALIRLTGSKSCERVITHE